ncbi:hypothetical protein ACFYS8_20700 [Kitasatospora sp. NPDC004615]|uniref:hypothetical protein n=1 Tax=unclassified Kitasatospora TaxID=2633591 RepID=UPI0036BA4543
MALVAGVRVKLVTELALGDASGDGETVGLLLLGAGIEGTVERVVGEVTAPEEVREYERLRALHDDYGHTMPTESLKQLENEIAKLVPHWEAFQVRGPRSSVRVRFDNGFVLDGADEAVLTAL